MRMILRQVEEMENDELIDELVNMAIKINLLDLDLLSSCRELNRFLFRMKQEAKKRMNTCRPDDSANELLLSSLIELATRGLPHDSKANEILEIMSSAIVGTA